MLWGSHDEPSILWTAPILQVLQVVYESGILKIAILRQPYAPIMMASTQCLLGGACDTAALSDTRMSIRDCVLTIQVWWTGKGIDKFQLEEKSLPVAIALSGCAHLVKVLSYAELHNSLSSPVEERECSPAQCPQLTWKGPPGLAVSLMKLRPCDLSSHQHG